MMQDDIVSGDLLNDEDDEYNLQARSHEGKNEANKIECTIIKFLLRWKQSIWKYDRREGRN